MVSSFQPINGRVQIIVEIQELIRLIHLLEYRAEKFLTGFEFGFPCPLIYGALDAVFALV